MRHCQHARERERERNAEDVGMSTIVMPVEGSNGRRCVHIFESESGTSRDAGGQTAAGGQETSRARALTSFP